MKIWRCLATKFEKVELMTSEVVHLGRILPDLMTGIAERIETARYSMAQAKHVLVNSGSDHSAHNAYHSRGLAMAAQKRGSECEQSESGGLGDNVDALHVARSFATNVE